MLEQWKNKIKALFKDDEKIEVTKNNELNQVQQNVQAKIKYQYPNKKSFRFPVIPDTVAERKVKSDTPSYQRKRNNNPDENRKKLGKQPSISNHKVYKKNNDIPFEPTDVPSPIHGFQQRKKDKEIEEVPAFKRKQEEQEKPEDNKPNDMQQFVENTQVEEKTAPQDVIHNEVASTNEPVTNQEQPVTPIRQPVEDIKKDDTQKKTENKQRKINTRHKKTTQQGPYNVIMTPRDKKNLFDKSARNAEKKENPEKLTRPIPFHLLNDPVQKTNEDHLWVKQQQRLLEETLKHFNVRARVVNATQGPSVTRFEVHPELGVKVSKVKNLSDDLKLNMSAKDIRIEAPIPGKNTIGIEIPNLHAEMVGLQGIFETEQFRQSTSPLTIALGLSIEGLPMITNIQKMPHGLIAGATGSGKSVCINTILISLLYKASHEDVKFLLIDPKMVELAPYNGIPHLVSPVITDVKAATAALKWAVREMEDRYERFVQAGVRDIERFNQKMINQGQTVEKMPFIVIVIDELADLMMSSPQDVEDAISKIAQKARACGIHLLLATQRPSVDVITGLIKANIPTRIAFSVSSQVDSRTIIDTGGAEKLLGKGDMLFIENGAGQSIRLQGPFVSDEEIERVTSHVRNIAAPNYLFEQEQLLEQTYADEEEDVLLQDATQFVLNHNSASTSLLQRHFKIGYNRAARLIDTLESKGIISGQNGSKPREVLVTQTQIEEMQ
ncbi:DNA translocase FtsK [Virgibacillus profundi]|uniref:DNA translocase FtsK n=1 Tax=Virgibacillus profundi TaxID=2024555 RepID=A0A2A2IDP2_9BACI|nr:DNA translocase FtsK [Virgibacillus profundi]PAV30121.1 DNA translocase FtsK [Virgibacillus profundi]PXY54293.1 DNA translocase FtsK [Virgibacillus profundi]